jgi:hypothetical protein
MTSGWRLKIHSPRPYSLISAIGQFLAVLEREAHGALAESVYGSGLCQVPRHLHKPEKSGSDGWHAAEINFPILSVTVTLSMRWERAC